MSAGEATLSLGIATTEIIPVGWKTVRIGDALRLYNGAAFKPTQWTPSGLPIIRIQNLNNHRASYNYFDGDLGDRFRVRHGDLLFAWSGTPGTSFGAHIWKGSDAWLNQHIFRVEFDPGLFDREFLRLAINQNLQAYIAEAHGGAGLAHITKGRFEAFDLLCPPLSEQRRIMERLEALMARSRQARVLLAEVPEQLVRARQSLLASAFRGDLTADWRKNESCEGWKHAEVQAIASVGTGSTPSRTEPSYYANTGTPWITSSATSEPLVTKATEFVTQSAIRAHRLKVYPIGTLLIAMYGEGKTRGQVTQLGIPATINQACAAIVVNASLALSHFVRLALEANYLEMRALAEGGNQPNLNLSKVKQFPLSLPPLIEQHEIVRRLNEAFSRLNSAATAHTTAVAELDRLDQSLLARAFSGALVPQQFSVAAGDERTSSSETPHSQAKGQALPYLLRFIPALLRAADRPVSLDELCSVVAVVFLPLSDMLPLVERLGGSKARNHFSDCARTYDDGTFLGALRTLRSTGTLICDKDRRGALHFRVTAKLPPIPDEIDTDARLLAPLLPSIPTEKSVVRHRVRLQMPEVREAMLSVV